MAPWAVTATHGDGTNWTLVAILSPERELQERRTRMGDGPVVLAQ